MFELMHRHRRAVMIVILIFVGAPMAIFFGIPNPFRNSPGYEDLSQTVIEVYDQPVAAATFVNQYSSMVDRMRASGQEVPTAEELVKDKTVDDLIRGLINDALLTHEVKDRPYRPDQAFLEERLKDSAIFKDTQGNFNSGYYNRWVAEQIKAGMDWNGIWDMMADQARRDLYVSLITGSGRVLESEVRKEYEDRNTRIEVRYILVEPPIETLDETIQEHYNQNAENFQTEPKISAVVTAFTIKMEEPAIVREIIEKARAGEDFAKLAEEHSKASSRVDGGSMGWTPEAETLPGFRKTIFSMAVGAVSDPVDGPLGTYIYKVEEERKDEATGQREVLAREIVIPSRVDEAAQAEIHARATELIQKAQTGGGVKAAAEAAGLTPIAIGPFDSATVELPGIDQIDAPRLRTTLADSGIGVATEPVVATNNLYVTEVTSIDPPRVKTFDEAREDVIEDWKGNYKLTQDYVEDLNSLVDSIQSNLASFESLNTILEAFPELTTEIQTSKLFGRTDYLFDQGWFVDPGAVHDALEGKEPGAIAGPVKDFRNQYYFVELMERQEPTEDMWANDWPKKREEIREMAYAGLRDERMADYLQHQLETATENAQVFLDSEAMFALLGVSPEAQPEPAPESAAPAADDDAATAEGTESPAPEDETTPAAPVAPEADPAADGESLSQ